MPSVRIEQGGARILIRVDDFIMQINVAKGRLTQTFKFLKELNELRNPVPRQLSEYRRVLWIEKWPVHPFVEVRRGDREENDDEGAEGEIEPLVRIRRADLTPCPKPPGVLDGWLKPGWQAVEAEIEFLPSRNLADSEKGSVSVAFEDDERRVAAFDEWAAARKQWVVGEKPAVAARRLFEEIHALWTEMQREGDRAELVLGDGILNVSEYAIEHPVLLQRVSLAFDASGPEFKFDVGNRSVSRVAPS